MIRSWPIGMGLGCVGITKMFHPFASCHSHRSSAHHSVTQDSGSWLSNVKVSWAVKPSRFDTPAEQKVT